MFLDRFLKITLYDAQGILVTDDQTKAKLLNNYFASVGTVDNGCFPVVCHRSDSYAVSYTHLTLPTNREV